MRSYSIPICNSEFDKSNGTPPRSGLLWITSGHINASQPQAPPLACGNERALNLPLWFRADPYYRTNLDQVFDVRFVVLLRFSGHFHLGLY